MNAHDLILLTLQASVMAGVFALGLEAKVQDVTFVLRHPALLLRSLLAMFVAMPLLALLLGHVFDLALPTQIALMCLAVSPVPPLLPKKQDKAGGHSSYALGLMVCTAILSLAIIALWAQVLDRIFGRAFAMALGPIALLVIKMIVLPLAVGMALRALAPTLTVRLTRPAILVAGWLLPLGGVVVLYAAHSALLALMGNGTLIALMVFIAAGLLIGHLLGAPGRDEKIVLAMSTASRHPGVAIGLATANFPDNRQVPALILLYLVLGILATLAYMKWQQSSA